MTARLLVLAPLRIEARAVAAGAPGATVVRAGMGPKRAAATARRLNAPSPTRSGRPTGTTTLEPIGYPGGVAGHVAVAVAGVAGALVDGLGPGDLVVAALVVRPSGEVVARLPHAEALAGALRRAGLAARVAALVSTDHIVSGRDRRRRLAAASGAVAVDMESAALLREPWGAPTVVLRAIADRPGQELWSPATLANGTRACRSLRAAGPVLERWAAALPTASPSPLEVR